VCFIPFVYDSHSQADALCAQKEEGHFRGPPPFRKLGEFPLLASGY